MVVPRSEAKPCSREFHDVNATSAPNFLALAIVCLLIVVMCCQNPLCQGRDAVLMLMEENALYENGSRPVGLGGAARANLARE